MRANKSDLFQDLSRLVIAAVVGIVAASVASEARSQTVILSGSPFPESLAATTDGTLFASSLTNGGIARVKPGASEAEAWIKPGTFDTRSTFGVLADEKSGLLWVCSNDATPLGVKGPSTIEGSFVKGFDLTTGEGKVSARLPAKPSICNDLAVGPDGALYVTNTLQPQILRLKKGYSELDVWVQDDKLKGGLMGLRSDRMAPCTSTPSKAANSSASNPNRESRVPSRSLRRHAQSSFRTVLGQTRPDS